MTMFIPSPTLTTVAPLVSKDKGSLGNRVNCVGSQALNAAVTGSLAAGTLAGGIYLSKHTDKINNFVNSTAVKQTKKGAQNAINWLKQTKPVQYVKNKLAPFIQELGNKKMFKSIGKWAKQVKDFITNGVKAIEKLPTKGKYAILGTLGLLLAGGIYKSGQIDQKYTNRAEMEKHFI